jgi:uncharacterized membrane protein
MLIGNNGIFSPTFGLLMEKDMIREKKHEALIIIAFAGIFAGVAGIFAIISSKIADINCKYP